MNNKRRQQLVAAANPLLTAGERIELATVVKVGSVSVKRKLATAAVVGVLTAGTVIATASPRPMYLVMTDQRILFFEVDGLTGKPRKLLMVLPRELVTATPVAKALLGLGRVTQLEIDGQEQGLKVLFPPVSKADAAGFAAALRTAV
ncbi:hypothetical protein [Kitasatospora sp. HPMI-4]|uniref:YokE-like PH domain-containing protein n=1 Tax=Streptomyces citricolor TaxID=212427 RepID=A0A7R6FI66_9ACTN|nr:hypothetical protein [Streptomyces citricolor]